MPAKPRQLGCTVKNERLKFYLYTIYVTRLTGIMPSPFVSKSMNVSWNSSTALSLNPDFPDMVSFVLEIKVNCRCKLCPNLSRSFENEKSTALRCPKPISALDFMFKQLT